MLSLSTEPDLFIAAFQSLPFALMITDVDGIIRWANSRLLNLTGYADGEMVGQSAARLGFGMSEHALRTSRCGRSAQGSRRRGIWLSQEKTDLFILRNRPSLLSKM
jgi:PAS domain S-box-containing protein